MNDRTLRTVVAGLSGLLVLVIAVTLLIVVGRNGSGTASPSAPPIALASPSAGVTLTPTESTAPTPSTTPEPSATPEASPSAGGAAPSGSPGVPALATLTFLGLKLDADQDPGGEQRTVTFRSDGAGTVTAKLATSSPEGTTHMCFLVGKKDLGCKDWRSGTFTGKTTQAHATWKVTLLGTDFDAPTVDLTVSFQAVAPTVMIEHARFDGTAYPDTNGIQARFTARGAGEARLVATWGGHPFLYEIDLFDESGGSGNVTLSNQGPSTNTDEALAVTPGNWRLLLQNIEAGFGTTDLTARISFP